MLGLHFSPGLRFTFSLQSAFYTQSAFTPGPQSVVRSPQSTVHSPQSAIQGTFTYLVSNSVSKAVRFSIGRYEKKREFFDLFAAKSETGAMRFSGGIRSGAGTLSKYRFRPCYSIIRNSKTSTANSKSFKIAQKTAFGAKGRLYTTGKVNQRLFNIDLYTYLAIYGYGLGKR